MKAIYAWKNKFNEFWLSLQCEAKGKAGFVPLEKDGLPYVYSSQVGDDEEGVEHLVTDQELIDDLANNLASCAPDHRICAICLCITPRATYRQHMEAHGYDVFE